MNLFEDLSARKLIQQTTAEPAEFQSFITTKPIRFYCGFDPTSDSLHLGSLLPLLTMRRFQEAGHHPIAIAGGATGMIGDPSGKSAERNLLDSDTIAKNLRGIQKTIERFLDFSGKNKAILLNNATWFEKMNAIEYLRDLGKHFTVNYMLAKDSVSSRIDERGISYTEFSYMVFQAYDFYVLHRDHACALQIGGSDQWGNMTAGAELIRKKSPATTAHAMTFPLVTKADGTKFGKTESGNVWLDPEKTSPYQFYQFLLNTADQDACHYLRIFSFLKLSEITEIEKEFSQKPETRLAQKTLAEHLTKLVHGEAELNRAQKATAAFFSGDLKSLDAKTLKEVFADSPSSEINKDQLKAGLAIGDALVLTKLVDSKGAAKREITSGGIYVNNERVTDAAMTLNESHLLFGKYLVLRRGKKNFHLLAIT